MSVHVVPELFGLLERFEPWKAGQSIAGSGGKGTNVYGHFFLSMRVFMRLWARLQSTRSAMVPTRAMRAWSW